MFSSVMGSILVVQELTSRYGGHYLLTMTTPVEEEEKVVRLVHSLSRNARRVYSLAGTQKFELPTDEVGWRRHVGEKSGKEEGHWKGESYRSNIDAHVILLVRERIGKDE